MLSFAVPRKVHLQSMGCCLLASLVPASGWGELVTSPFNYWDPTVIISQAGDSHCLPRALWDSSTFCVGSQKKPHSPNQQSSSSPSIVCWWDNQLQAAPELPELLWAIGRGCFFHSVANSVELLRLFVFYIFWVYLFLFYYLFYNLALIKDRGLDRIQAAKNQPESNKTNIFISLINTSIVLCCTNLAVVLHGIYAKCLILRASTVNATHEHFSEQGGVCYQALLLQRGHDPSFCRGGTEILTAYIWHTKGGSVPIPQIIPVSCELEKHVYFLIYSNLPWGKKTPTIQQYHHRHTVWWYQNYIVIYFFSWFSTHSSSEAWKNRELHKLWIIPSGDHWTFWLSLGWNNNSRVKHIPDRTKCFMLRQRYLKGKIN